MAARAAADESGCRRRRRARRERLDRDAHGARDAHARPSARCSCCARSSTCPTTRSPRRSDKTPAAVRQIAHRAKEHVAARRPRMRVDRSEQEEVVERFVAAVNTGDLQGLMDVLAPDVVSVADGGGKVRGAARRRSSARTRLGATSWAAWRSSRSAVVATPTWVNGQPGSARRGRRRARRRREPDHRGRADHAHLLGRQPRQARAAGGKRPCHRQGAGDDLRMGHVPMTPDARAAPASTAVESTWRPSIWGSMGAQAVRGRELPCVSSGVHGGAGRSRP